MLLLSLRHFFDSVPTLLSLLVFLTLILLHLCVLIDTGTVYVKGAEVVGLYRTLLGTEGFKKGMKLYFERFDGKAVTCDDFRIAMAGMHM